MLMTESIPQGCHACLYLATGEPVIRCLRGWVFPRHLLGACHAACARPSLLHGSILRLCGESEFHLLGPDPRPSREVQKPHLTQSIIAPFLEQEKVKKSFLSYCEFFFFH